MAVSFERTIPILRMFSVEKAKEFYVDYLGFQIDWEHKFPEVAPVYMQVSRAGLVLHLSEHYGDATPGSSIYVQMCGIEEFHRELTARNYGYLRPGLDQTPWNTRCVNVTDPFGNHIRFNEPLT
ncbi:MAG: glyoxalase/bleomycin resistance/extradiol dioxygenase family protein [Candidatus Angelobacter sp. Gp1-AA117]|nr:MAG: glyoxalase/bleomycin resistance/extradiol dioxygenase family protein [Candidatus Angelobacter sp. Gp1-AA117]